MKPERVKTASGDPKNSQMKSPGDQPKDERAKTGNAKAREGKTPSKESRPPSEQNKSQREKTPSEQNKSQRQKTPSEQNKSQRQKTPSEQNKSQGQKTPTKDERPGTTSHEDKLEEEGFNEKKSDRTKTPAEEKNEEEPQAEEQPTEENKEEFPAEGNQDEPSNDKLGEKAESYEEEKKIETTVDETKKEIPDASVSYREVELIKQNEKLKAVEGDINSLSPELQSIIMGIIKKFDETGEMFEDEEFPANDASLYKDPVNPPDYAKDIAFVEWKRPQEINSNPQLVMDGISPGDVVQGILGDCWLLGCFCCMATRSELLHDLILYDGLEYGVVVIQFFKDGVWKPVVVDTKLPYDPKSKKLLYARGDRDDEFWVSYLEKAYAKLYGNYQELDGGKMQDALVDLTGSITEKCNIREVVGEGQANPTMALELWRAIKQYSQAGYVMGCSLNDKNSKVTISPEGIVVNHAYGILSVREIQTLKLIRIRNPWGKGEWRGAFSDDDDSWDNYKGLREALGHELKDDGIFWMEFNDWYKYYNKLYIAKIFPITWEQYSIPCAWKGKTNGGRKFLVIISTPIHC